MSFIVTDGMGTQVISIESLQETIHQQQAEISRLTEQRDRLVAALDVAKDRATKSEYAKYKALIEEIEAGK